MAYTKQQLEGRLRLAGGLGSMGFGLPSALGAAAAYAEEGREAKVVVDIDGDGSFLMNIQVRMTAHGAAMLLAVAG